MDVESIYLAKSIFINEYIKGSIYFVSEIVSGIYMHLWFTMHVHSGYWYIHIHQNGYVPISSDFPLLL